MDNEHIQDYISNKSALASSWTLPHTHKGIDIISLNVKHKEQGKHICQKTRHGHRKTLHCFDLDVFLRNNVFACRNVRSVFSPHGVEHITNVGYYYYANAEEREEKTVTKNEREVTVTSPSFLVTDFWFVSSSLVCRLLHYLFLFFSLFLLKHRSALSFLCVRVLSAFGEHICLVLYCLLFLTSSRSLGLNQTT